MRLPEDNELPDDQIRIRDLDPGDNFVIRDADGNSIYAGWVDSEGITCVIPNEDPNLNDDNPMRSVWDEFVFINQVRAGWKLERVTVV